MTEHQCQFIEQIRVYEGFLNVDKVKLRHTLYAGGWSAEFRREVLVREPAAAVILYDPDQDKLVLVEQFRIGAAAAGKPCWMIEVVAGLIDEGMTPAESAAKEAMEEAGCETQDLFHIIDYFPSPGGCSEIVSLFCARVDSTDVDGLYGLAHENEDVRAMAVPVATVMAWVDTGRITNGLTLMALLWFARHRDALRQRWGAA